MGIISNVEPLSKTKYRIYIDGQFAFVIHKGELLHYRMEEGCELSDEIQQELLEDVIYKDAKAYVNRILMTADKTEHQLRSGLAGKEFPQEIIDRVIDLCTEQKLLDDRRYAENYINSYSERKSSRVIRMELQQRGVSEEIIDSVFRVQDTGEMEKQAIMKLLNKKWPDRQEKTYEEMQKLMAFLMRKGFSYEVIKKSIREYTCNELGK